MAQLIPLKREEGWGTLARNVSPSFQPQANGCLHLHLHGEGEQGTQPGRRVRSFQIVGLPLAGQSPLSDYAMSLRGAAALPCGSLCLFLWAQTAAVMAHSPVFRGEVAALLLQVPSRYVASPPALLSPGRTMLSWPQPLAARLTRQGSGQVLGCSSLGVPSGLPGLPSCAGPLVAPCPP